MGKVHEARHVRTKRVCALKTLHPAVAEIPAVRERFLREAQASAAIDHPGIVEVYDADEHDGQLYVAMELLIGEDLEARFSNPTVGLADKLALMEGMLEPLAAAHEAGFVHRDLKPHNAFVSRTRGGGERVKLLDFGLVHQMGRSTQLTKSGVTMGTLHYMSPEQARSAKDVTPAADVWSVGVMLYQAATGQLPFHANSIADVIVSLCTEPHPALDDVAPGLPLPLVELIDDCLEKSPDKRPPHAAAVLIRLRSLDLGMRPTMPSAAGISREELLGLAIASNVPAPEPAVVVAVPKVPSPQPAPPPDLDLGRPSIDPVVLPTGRGPAVAGGVLLVVALLATAFALVQLGVF